MSVLKRLRQAGRADRHYLYQESVQDTEAEIDFVQETWAQLRGRPAELLREDFCGTANTACEWVRRDPQHYSIGVDLDAEVLEWGRLNNLEQLGITPGPIYSTILDDLFYAALDERVKTVEEEKAFVQRKYQK